MGLISNVKIITTSMVSYNDFQQVVVCFDCTEKKELYLQVCREKSVVVSDVLMMADVGENCIKLLLPVQEVTFDAIWRICGKDRKLVFEAVSEWKTPRPWTLYAMVSSHTDIGLHNSQSYRW